MAMRWAKREESPTFIRWTAPDGAGGEWEIQQKELCRSGKPHVVIVWILWPPLNILAPTFHLSFDEAKRTANELRSGGIR